MARRAGRCIALANRLALHDCAVVAIRRDSAPSSQLRAVFSLQRADAAAHDLAKEVRGTSVALRRGTLIVQLGSTSPLSSAEIAKALEETGYVTCVPPEPGIQGRQSDQRYWTCRKQYQSRSIDCSQSRCQLPNDAFVHHYLNELIAEKREKEDLTALAEIAAISPVQLGHVPRSLRSLRP